MWQLRRWFMAYDAFLKWWERRRRAQTDRLLWRIWGRMYAGCTTNRAIPALGKMLRLSDGMAVSLVAMKGEFELALTRNYFRVSGHSRTTGLVLQFYHGWILRNYPTIDRPIRKLAEASSSIGTARDKQNANATMQAPQVRILLRSCRLHSLNLDWGLSEHSPCWWTTPLCALIVPSVWRIAQMREGVRAC